MDISIKMCTSQSIIIAKFAIKTFLISLSILLYCGKYQQRRTSEDSIRLDKFDFVEPIETSESSRAVPTWRTTNKL